ncbi:MAG: DNA topoisomerase IV subunit A [Kiritimatiellaeota bacterium]|nr:DNA topoisomerase IV subunit A [Kiritimatiellota bacterium]
MKKPPDKKKKNNDSPEALPDLFALPVVADNVDNIDNIDASDVVADAPNPQPSAPSLQPPSKHGGRGALRDLMDGNFLQFAAYTICHRAIPTIEDGLKPVQRRILHALWEQDDGRFTKVASVVGDAVKYHPHGDASIGDAIVNLVNKRHLIEGQGNFGNLLTGDPAAATRYIECRLTPLAREELFNPKTTRFIPSYDGRNLLTGDPAAATRYIECRLTPLAREELFNPKTTRFIPSYDGRNDEPVLLPSKLPLLLMLGADGIAVGLTTTVLPHNFIELLEAQIAILNDKPFSVLPDFQTGGLMDVSEYNDGNGKVRLRAGVDVEKNRLVIRELPFGLTTKRLIETIEDAIDRKKVPVRQINDYTAEKVEIELLLSPGASAEAAEKALYAFTACETPVTSRIVTLYQNRPFETTVSEILRINTRQLLDLLKRELEIRQAELADAHHAKTLEQIFIENRVYKRIEEQKTADDVKTAVLDGLAPFRAQLDRDITADDVERLLQIRIRRISLYDINKNRDELAAIAHEQTEVAGHLRTLKKYAVNYLKRLIKQHEKNNPRLTRVTTFDAIELRSLTATELQIKIDRDAGFLGHDIKGEPFMQCSSLDKLLIVWADGRYRMLPPPDKFFVDKTMHLCRLFDRDAQMLCVYTEKAHGFTYIKRFTFGGCIQNKDYRLCPEGSKLLLLQEGLPEALYVKYKPAKSQRIHQQIFVPSEVAVKGVSARGIQMTSKDIEKLAAEKPRWWQDGEESPKGLLG